jgi:hypothetical protein
VASGEDLTPSSQQVVVLDELIWFRRNWEIQATAVEATMVYTASTDANGNYVLSDLPAGVYTLVPPRSGRIFSPTSRTVAVPPDARSQDVTIQGGGPVPAIWS